MERVAFLIEETNERLGCLLNPEGLVMRRKAGVRARRSATGHLTGTGLSDDPLLFTGGGRTELQLDLLFDVQLGGSTVTDPDVRALTRPLWNLAEQTGSEAQRRLSLVRFVWGKSWNILGAVVAVAERLEHFTQAGVPQRSWIRLLFLRLDQPPPEPATMVRSPASFSEEELAQLEEGGVHELIGGTGVGPSGDEGAEGVATADELVGAALEESGAAATLDAAQRQIAGAAEAALQGLSAFLASVPDEEAASAESASSPSEPVADSEEDEAAPPSLEEAAAGVATAFSGMLSALDVFASAAKAEVFEAVATATSEIASASSAAARHLDRLAGGAGQALVDGCRRALSDIDDGVDAMIAAASDAAAVVKARTSAMIATAADGLDAFAQDVEEELASVATWTSEVGEQVMAGIQTALEPMRALATDVRATGQAALDAVAPALGAIGAEVEKLWAAGEEIAAEGVAAAVGAAAFVLKNAREAHDALASASQARTAQAITASVADVRVALEEQPSPADAATAETIEVSLVEIEARMNLVTTPAPKKALQPAERAVAYVRASLGTSKPDVEAPPVADEAAATPEEDAPEVIPETEAAETTDAPDETKPAPSAPSSVAEALGIIEAATAAMLAAEQAAVAALIQTAAREQRHTDVAEVTPERAAPTSAKGRRLQQQASPSSTETSVGFGERLEHVAYRYYRDPALWRVLAAANGLDDPLHLPSGFNLRVPSLLGGGRP